jgi:pseudouridine-5'-phosphate glycosidase
MRKCEPIVAEEVAEAIAARRAVVALETTLVTHGLPQPDGMRVAMALEDAVRERGAVPATIGIVEGKVCVGINRAELEQLATAPNVIKLNLSNFAASLAAGANGSTTVAATMFVADRVGIEVFATGGIGGVHRGSVESGDVSADLVALSRYQVAVVCAGAKAILDLSKTVEMLETLGVPVLGYGTDEFPAFYRRQSGLRVDRRCDDVAALAGAVRKHFDLGFGTGVVIGNPIPAADELPYEIYERAIVKALAEASTQGVKGREVTPFLLEHMRQLTEGKSVAVNEALLVNNMRVAAELAVEMARLK